MKRTYALLLFLFILLIASAALSEVPFSPPTIPEFSADYGLTQLYGDLEEDWGHVQHWTLEQKAWLSSELDALMEMENARRDATGSEPTTRSAYPLGFYRHGQPDETVIDQATALSLACEQFIAQGAPLSPEEMADISFYYLVDFPEQPVWYHAVSIAGTLYRTYMDARTGRPSHSSVFNVLDTAAAQLPADIPLHLYDAVPLYRPADGQWEVHFHYVLPDSSKYVVTLSDTTLEVLDVTQMTE